MESFFTFPDRALKYDCPSCGSFCCKGKGVALEAREEVVCFARIEPRMAALIYPFDHSFARVLDATDGCWMLKPDGLCAIDWSTATRRSRTPAGSSPSTASSRSARCGWWTSIRRSARFKTRPTRALDRAGRSCRSRSVLQSWRAHHGVEGDGRLAEASRLAARHASLLTCSWRLSMLLSREAAPYPHVIRMLPRHLLATSHLLELSHLARRTAPGLRAATETFQDAAPLIGLLALFPQRARLKAPLDVGIAVDVQPALEALSRELLEGGPTMAEAAESALAPFPVHLRSMALTALAFGNAELLVE